MDAILEQLFGALVAIATTITVEYLRRPKLKLDIATPVDLTYSAGTRLAKKARYLLVSCTNKPLPWCFRWMQRNAATDCHGSLTLHHLDGQNYFGRSMPLRWSGSPEPIPLQVSIGGAVASIFDPNRNSTESLVDIQPGEQRACDTAVKFDDEPECYGWSNSNYSSNPPWRHPDWRLPAGRYLVRVIMVSAGQRCEAIFRVVNDVPQRDFRLEQPLPGDSIRG